jgi:hypothetical protein
MTGERQLFIDYRVALDAGDAERARQILGMTSASTRKAIAWWAEQPVADRPLSPFVSANPAWDAPGTVISAQAALDNANGYLHLAETYLARSHTLELFAALLTIAFLAGGLTGVFESTRSKLFLLTVSIIVLLGCGIGAVIYW